MLILVIILRNNYSTLAFCENWEYSTFFYLINPHSIIFAVRYVLKKIYIEWVKFWWSFFSSCFLDLGNPIVYLRFLIGVGSIERAVYSCAFSTRRGQYKDLLVFFFLFLQKTNSIPCHPIVDLQANATARITL